MSLLKQYFPLTNLIVNYQLVIAHIMSKQKVWDYIFIKDVYKTDYVMKLWYV